MSTTPTKTKKPKQPQDHKPKSEKAPKPKVTEIEGGWTIEHRGITFNVMRDALDDFELLDDLAELQKDEKRGTVRVPDMLRRLAGPDGFQTVLDGLRDPRTGRVQASVATQFVFESFQALNPNS